MKTISRSGWALALVAGLLAPGAVIAQASGGGMAPMLHEGVVVDAARGAAYVMSPQGGIDAIQLSSGNVMWKSREAAKPLLVKDGVLIAQANPGRDGALVLVTLDASRGTARDRMEVEVPQGLRANVVDGPTQKFHARAFVAADSSVVVTWTAQDGRRLQGLLAPEADEPTSEESAVASAVAPLAAVAAVTPLRGAARLDLAARKAVPMAFEKAEAVRASTASVKVATSVAAARQLASLDGRHILRSERSPEGSPWNAWRWTVTDASSGARVGTVDAPVSMAQFVVSGNQILYVAKPSARREAGKIVQEPLRLVALDLRSGIEVWKAPVVDSTYRGPFPP